MKYFLLTAILSVAGLFISYAQDKYGEADSIPILPEENTSIKRDSLSLPLEEPAAVSAQDSLLKNSMRELLFESPDKAFMLNNNYPLSPNPNESFLLSPNLIPNLSSSFNYFDSDYLTVTPYSYNFYNWREGGEMAGINNHIRISDNFWSDINVSATSSYASFLQPDRYYNGSIALRATFQPHDRIRIITYGQISLREGINPILDPVINGGNYYGAELQIRVYKNFGIGFGIKRSYYRNDWSTFKYMNPAIF